MKGAVTAEPLRWPTDRPARVLVGRLTLEFMREAHVHMWPLYATVERERSYSGERATWKFRIAWFDRLSAKFTVRV